MGQWRDKVVLVTGASRGIGQATAAAFASRGARVLMTARGSADLEAAVAAICAAGGVAQGLVCDVTDPDAAALMTRTAIERFGCLDVLVNNAGRSMRRPILDTSLDDFRDLMELNFFSLVRCTQAALPHLIERRGHLVNVSSLAGKSAARFMGAYPASKFAVIAYSQQLRLELSERGLHVMAVCPGPVQTGLIDKALAGEDLSAVPERMRKPGAGLRTRTLSAAEVAEAIVAGCESRSGELIFPWWGRLLLALQQLSPALSDAIVRTLT